MFLVSCGPKPIIDEPVVEEPVIEEVVVEEPVVEAKPIIVPTHSPILIPRSNPPTWQILYNGKFQEAKADYAILDLFEFSAENVKELKDSGTTPIAYFSAHYENWRPDASKFGKLLGKIGGWKGERYIDWTDPKSQAVMKARMDLAKQKGFLGLDPDNVDGPNGEKYFPWLYKEAKERGLMIGLKNFVEVLPKWGDKVDYFVSEASSLNELTCYKKYSKPTVRMYYGKGAKTPDFIFELKSGGSSRF